MNRLFVETGEGRYTGRWKFTDALPIHPARFIVYFNGIFYKAGMLFYWYLRLTIGGELKKSCIMEKNAAQQEILLMTGSAFFQQQCYEKNEQDSNKNISQIEKLEEACWNGLLGELLPGLIERSSEGKALLLWEIRHGNSFLELDLCETPAKPDYYYSIDPYMFLNEGNNN